MSRAVKKFNVAPPASRLPFVSFKRHGGGVQSNYWTYRMPSNWRDNDAAWSRAIADAEDGAFELLRLIQDGHGTGALLERIVADMGRRENWQTRAFLRIVEQCLSLGVKHADLDGWHARTQEARRQEAEATKRYTQEEARARSERAKRAARTRAARKAA